MTTPHRIAAVLLAGLTLAGCTTHDDPARGGFFSGVKDMTDGTYNRRLQNQKQALENEQDRNTQEKRSLDRVNAERDSLAADRAAAEGKYTAMQSDLATAKRKLAASQAANASAKRKVADLQQQVDDLQARISMVKQDSFTPEADKQQQLDSLRKEKEALEKEVDMALHR